MEFDKLIIKFIWIVKGTKIVKIILKKNKIREIAHHISRVRVKEVSYGALSLKTWKEAWRVLLLLNTHLLFRTR